MSNIIPLTPCQILSPQHHVKYYPPQHHVKYYPPNTMSNIIPQDHVKYYPPNTFSSHVTVWAH